MRKSVLVTGSSRGIGKAIALRLARDDYDIVLHCRSQLEETDSVAQSIVALGRQARVLQFDVGERQATAAALEADIDEHGCYYGVVCNAGIARDKLPPLEPAHDGFGVVAGLVVDLLHAAEQEHLVVHRQAEEHA